LQGIEVALTVLDPDHISLQLRDDDGVLSPEQIFQAWEPYYQGEKKPTGEVAGMGLGLATVASLVWEAGGSWRIFNRDPEPGVVVELVLPLYRPEDAV
jgi:nitrogen fixation/metabolism regulation signal transduction histidine kinase